MLKHLRTAWTYFWFMPMIACWLTGLLFAYITGDKDLLREYCK